MNHFSQNCDVTVFYVILEFHEFYHFYILGKGKVTQGYLQFMTIFMRKLKNPKKPDNILHFQTSATHTSIESTVGPLLLRILIARKLTKSRTLTQFTISKLKKFKIEFCHHIKEVQLYWFQCQTRVVIENVKCDSM